MPVVPHPDVALGAHRVDAFGQLLGFGGVAFFGAETFAFGADGVEPLGRDLILLLVGGFDRLVQVAHQRREQVVDQPRDAPVQPETLGEPFFALRTDAPERTLEHLNLRAAEPIDGLLRVAHAEERARPQRPRLAAPATAGKLPGRARQQVHDFELQEVGVLEFVDEDGTVGAAAGFEDAGVGPQEVAGADLEVLKIEGRATALRLVVAGLHPPRRPEHRAGHRQMLPLDLFVEDGKVVVDLLEGVLEGFRGILDGLEGAGGGPVLFDSPLKADRQERLDRRLHHVRRPPLRDPVHRVQHGAPDQFA
ncbi:MAG: hypothetical protein NTX40_09765, partial [Planctomycetota bacterium]|nr:hypothetical protein [Planctomycetota bacterium]